MFFLSITVTNSTRSNTQRIQNTLRTNVMHHCKYQPIFNLVVIFALNYIIIIKFKTITTTIYVSFYQYTLLLVTSQDIGHTGRDYFFAIRNFRPSKKKKFLDTRYTLYAVYLQVTCQRVFVGAFRKTPRNRCSIKSRL
jgi:hypothetical protein